VRHNGSELFEIPANRYLEAYLKSGTRKDQRKACEWSRKTLKAWIDGVDYCNDRTHCRTRDFRARCKLIAERADLWKRAEEETCRGL
jgi:hypothetical protein